MPSVALIRWQNDRTLRLNEVDSHCALVDALVPPNPTFLDETLRGFVLHLSAHFQGFCRDLYTEGTQICIAAIPPWLQSTAQSQFSAHLALERGNPNYHNITRDFNRFGFKLDLQGANPTCAQQLNDLAHLNAWRNRAAHQGIQPLGASVPPVLTLAVLQVWRASCDGLASALDDIMNAELLQILGSPPW